MDKEQAYVYLPTPSESADPNRVGFIRKAIANLTPKEQAFYEATKDRKTNSPEDLENLQSAVKLLFGAALA